MRDDYDEAAAGRERLTATEREVLALAARGLNNRAIGAELGLTQNAVRFHLKHIHAKLETGGRRLLRRRLTGFLAAPFAAIHAAGPAVATVVAVGGLSVGGLLVVRTGQGLAESGDSAEGAGTRAEGRYCGSALAPTPGPGGTVPAPSAPICADTLVELWRLAGPFANCLEPREGDEHLECW